MNKSKQVLLCGIVAATLSTSMTARAESVYNLTLCGASPGGLWSLIGAGIDEAVKASYPGSTITYQTSGGGYANALQLDKGKCDLALIHDAEARAAINGAKPFKAKIDSMKTMAAIYTWAPMQFIVNKSYADKHGIKSLEDVAAKKLPINILLNRRGNVSSAVGNSMLNAAGASIKNIESWGGSVTYAASKEQGEMIRDRRADAILNSLFVNHRSVRQLASAIDLELLPINDATANKVAKEWNIGKHVIKGSSYKWAPEDTLTVTLAVQLYVRDDADKKMVKDITTALVENVAKVQGAHKAMGALNTKMMANSKAVAYHPAAESVYKAKGLK